MTTLMIIVGIILLLPGLCAVLLGVIAISDRWFPSDLVSFFVMALLAGFAGVMPIRAAERGGRS